MTRLDLFKNWLKSQGADPSHFEGFCPDTHGCAMLRCPENLPKHENGTFDCDDCPYNNFWTKEVDDV